jgi:hypothetical protein
LYNVISGVNSTVDYTTTAPASGTITLTEGYYTSAELAAHIQTVLQAIDANFTVSYNINTGKLTIANGVNDFSFDFTSGESQTHKLFGANYGATTEGATYTSDFPILINPNDVIFIRINEDENRKLHTEDNFSQSFMISSVSLFGEVMRIDSESNLTDQVIKLRKSRKLEIAFYNKYNQQLAIKDFTLILKRN